MKQRIDDDVKMMIIMTIMMIVMMMIVMTNDGDNRNKILSELIRPQIDYAHI